MTGRAVNLASRPFRNEALPRLLRITATVALGLVTLQHAFVLRGLLSGRTSEMHRQVAGLEAELRTLKSESAMLQGPRPDPRSLAQWTLVKELVDRRTFWWSDLFSRLEDVLPPDVRLVSVSPAVKEGRVELKILAAMRTVQQGLDLVRAFEERPEFEDVYPESAGETGTEGLEVAYAMRYMPPPPPLPVAPPAAEGSPGPRGMAMSASAGAAPRGEPAGAGQAP